VVAGALKTDIVGVAVDAVIDAAVVDALVIIESEVCVALGADIGF
jgi:hypothetical protein